MGEILRREGIYASQVASWRNSLEEVIANGLPEKKRGRKTSQTTCSHSGKSSSGAAHHRGLKKIAEMYRTEVLDNDEDRAKIFHILHDERFIDLCPREIVPTLADEGIYLGSIRSFYRVLAANNELCERRNIARHPKHCAPVLEANAPGEVWS